MPELRMHRPKAVQTASVTKGPPGWRWQGNAPAPASFVAFLRMKQRPDTRGFGSPMGPADGKNKKIESKPSSDSWGPPGSRVAPESRRGNGCPVPSEQLGGRTCSCQSLVITGLELKLRPQRPFVSRWLASPCPTPTLSSKPANVRSLNKPDLPAPLPLLTPGSHSGIPCLPSQETYFQRDPSAVTSSRKPSLVHPRRGPGRPQWSVVSQGLCSRNPTLSWDCLPFLAVPTPPHRSRPGSWHLGGGQPDLSSV